VARGPDATYAVRARDGTQVWSFPAGKYANPVVADKERMYLTGRAGQYAFAKPGSAVVKAYLKQQRRREKRQESR
jgi:outer membrane protein assembly factor BamB